MFIAPIYKLAVILEQHTNHQQRQNKLDN